MNLIVDPHKKVIKALVDWEFSGFYPIDMDFHSLLYFDRHQEWKWCGAEDVAIANEILEAFRYKPEGYADRLIWFDLLQLAKDLCHYRDWFIDQPDKLLEYESALERRLNVFLDTCEMILGR